MIARILKLDIAGRPIAWISREDGALLYCREQVAWEAGIEKFTLRGGYSRVTGQRSVMKLNSIIATRTVDRKADSKMKAPTLTNAQLFRRDNHTCLYCGEVFPASLLSRDHVVPVSAGGRDEWSNVVTACQPCNHKKDNYLLEEIEMHLLAVPYVPNQAESLILQNRRILADQMDFLRTRISPMSRLYTLRGH